MARRPHKKGPTASVKAAADRAEKRAKGEPIDEPKVAIDPKIDRTEEAAAAPVLGRPTEYDPSYDERATELCSAGATDDQLAEEFGVSTRTINRWKVAHPSFRHALKDAKDVADERVKRSLYHQSLGVEYEEMQAIKLKRVTYADGKRVKEEEFVELVPVKKFMPPSTVAGVFWMKNRDRRNWADRQQVEHGKVGDFDQMSDEELDAHIQSEAAALADARKSSKSVKATKH